MTAVLIDFLLVSTPILGAALVLSHIYHRSSSRDLILRCAVFASIVGAVFRRFLSQARPSDAAIVVDRLPANAIGIGWVTVAATLLVMFLIRHGIFIRRLAKARRIEDGVWVASLHALGGETLAGLAIVTDAFASPFCVGRRIFLPQWTLRSFDGDERTSVLAHELEHLRRRDSQWALLMGIVCAIFSPQPLLLLVKHQLQAVAEERADGAAVRSVGCGIPLARVLLRVTEHGTQHEPLLALWKRESELVRRVRKMVGPAEAAKLSRYVIPLQIAVSFVAVGLLPAFAVVEPAMMQPIVRAVMRTTSIPPRQPDTVLSLMRVLRADESPQVRYAAAKSLGRVGDSRALADLARAAIHDRDTNVRDAASYAERTVKR